MRRLRRRDRASFVLVDEDTQMMAVGRNRRENLAFDAKRPELEVRILGRLRQRQRETARLLELHGDTH